MNSMNARHPHDKEQSDVQAARQRKVGLITGGSSGIGLATAQRFVTEGAFVHISGCRQNELDMTAALIGRVATVQGDVQNFL